MNTDLVEIAEEKIAFYEGEIRRLKVFVELAHSLARERVMLSRAEPVSDDGEDVKPESPEVAHMGEMPHSLTPSSTDIILKEAADVLRQKGKPMSASEIFDIITRRGVRIAGKSPKGNLTAKFALKRDTFVLNKETKQWSLAEWS